MSCTSKSVEDIAHGLRCLWCRCPKAVGKLPVDDCDHSSRCAINLARVSSVLQAERDESNRLRGVVETMRECLIMAGIDPESTPYEVEAHCITAEQLELELGDATDIGITLRYEIDELRLTLAAEQGKPEGALPEWSWSNRDNMWYHSANKNRIWRESSYWILEWFTPSGMKVETNHPTARAAMRKSAMYAVGWMQP